MRYLLHTEISESLKQAIENINAISFEENQSVFDNEIVIVNSCDAEQNFSGRISLAADKSFGITQSFILDNRKVHLIIINEEYCKDLNANISAVIAHELGYIVNEYDKKLTAFQAALRGIKLDEVEKHNKIIRLENELHADSFAKKYGFVDEIIHNLKASLNQGFDDSEIQLRIDALNSDEIKITNTVKSHDI